MKILHIGKFYAPYKGGMERYLADLVEDQKAHGLNPTVIVHNHIPNRVPIHERVRGIEVTRVPSFGQLVYAPVAPSFGLHLAKLIKKIEPDIIHLHVPNLSGFWLLLLNKKIPLVVQWQSDIVPSEIDIKLKILYPFYRFFEKRLLEQAQAIIASSANYLLASEALRPFKHKCSVIPLGLNPERIHSPTAEKIAAIKKNYTQKPMILSAGRFTYYKGFQFLIEAAKQVPEACFTIVGNGPLRNNCTRRIKELALQNRVFLPGQLSDKKLQALMAACAAFCLPSIERTEAFGIVLLEAMAFGKPLITTNLMGSGVNWVNLDGETGVVVNEADPEALAKGIRWLLREPNRAAKMGKKSLHRLHTHFHIRTVSDRITALYETLQTPPTAGS